jgi:maleate isomerase
VGIAVPQANPTVEPEMRELLPRDIGVYATRLTHSSPRVEERLEHYVTHIPDAIRTFGTLDLAAFGFGCTGSSYIAGREREDRLTAEAHAECRLPIVTAAQAVRLALETLGAKRFALVSPYPQALSEAGYVYWRAAGYALTATLQVDPVLSDTHAIYELTSDDALAALRRLDARGADCIVCSGTGMPTLRALRHFASESTPPVLSSNLCLAWALCRAAAPELAPTTPCEWLR